ncbi:uncharacterized protein LODBEIA_P59290 [Lodderomyces beijingensis]|uniref:Ribonuclease n=1 Tax=Lodderomyces beijingensis TaxID=1775926 RepID=A0ABP0ZVZ4_9ASCO
MPLALPTANAAAGGGDISPLLKAGVKRMAGEEANETTEAKSKHDSISASLERETKRAKTDSGIWLPPSVSQIPNPQEFKTTTYMSAVPVAIVNNPTASVELGVDEAGRGPVLGPMVYGVAYSLEHFSKNLQRDYGFADSKQLTDEKRQSLLRMIEDGDEGGTQLNQNVGWCTTTMTAKDISRGMLKSVSNGHGTYNLNEQAHDATIDLIRRVLAQGVNVRRIYVDTVGPPVTYQAKLKKLFPTIEITVAKKADSIYPIVSAASVVAKVTRDLNLQFFNREMELASGRPHKLGSGYPSDPNTSAWLNANVDPVFGWCFGLIRFSWQTAKDCLKRHSAVEVVYRDDCFKDKGYKDVTKLMDTAHSTRGKIKKSHFCNDEVDWM